MNDAKKNGKHIVRCALYTRKSTEEGLEQEFNSLDAQRESGEAFVKSQAHEGWICLPERYDDGGFSGGNIDRPALARLLADIQAGKIDTVIVYKVDRLSRSLLDFAKMMETFDTYHVSFVSVTQQFNTATSMGRLVLNVLLSFAQFEREIISERTRDKIAATRRKGKWSGGHPLLGYDVDGAKLVINKREAKQVRATFSLYLRHQGLIPVVQELERRRWIGKRWVTRKGKTRGGKPFTKTSLHRLLTNVIYIGQVPYRSEVHHGEHVAIVAADIWRQTQALLHRNGAPGSAAGAQRDGAPLRGLLRCAPCGCAMVPSFSVKNRTLRYRYYVCCNAQRRGWATCPTKSIPATAIEQFVLERVRDLFLDRVSLLEAVTQTCRHDASGSDEDEQESANASTSVQSILDDEQRRKHVARHLSAAWEGSPADERFRILRRVVEQVDYDGAHGNVSISFRGSGILELLREWSQRSEEASS